MNEAQKEAYRQMARALRTGVLIRPDACSACGDHRYSRAIHAHHADYARPLDVEWLCATCHRRRHAGDRRRPYVMREREDKPVTVAGIGDTMRCMRESSGMSIEDVATMIDVPADHISRLENGDGLIALDGFLRLCDALKTSPSVVLR